MTNSSYLFLIFITIVGAKNVFLNHSYSNETDIYILCEPDYLKQPLTNTYLDKLIISIQKYYIIDGVFFHDDKSTVSLTLGKIYAVSLSNLIAIRWTGDLICMSWRHMYYYLDVNKFEEKCNQQCQNIYSLNNYIIDVQTANIENISTFHQAYIFNTIDEIVSNSVSRIEYYIYPIVTLTIIYLLSEQL